MQPQKPYQSNNYNVPQPPPYYQAPLPPPPPPVKSGRGLRSVILVVLLLVIAGVVVQSTLFRVERVMVSGCVYLSPEQVVERSGLYYGQNMLSINKETIEKSVNADRYMVFQDLKRDYATRTVTLYIYERVPVCTMQTRGIQYTLDAMGVVLEQTEELSVIDGLIILTGLKSTDCGLGRQVSVEKRERLDVYQSILYELNLMGYTQMISELNVLDLDNLYLVTADGMSVKLGSASYMHAKIVSLMTVREELAKMGKSKGTVDISSPVYPVYIP